MSTPHNSDMNVSTPPGRSGGRSSRWLKRGLVALPVILVLGWGAIYVDANYTNLILGGGEDPLDQSDLDAALVAGSADGATDATADATGDVIGDPADPTDPSTATAEPTTAPVETEPPADTEAPAAETSQGNGVWTVTDASELGYRVKEVVFGVDTDGVGRTNQITGSLVIDGTQVTEAEFVVDVASIESDDGRRDGQFRGRIMSTDEFPTATFTLTEPIELGVESAEGASVEATATGELTLRGVTNQVTFDVTAQQQSGQIGVLGNIPVVFADYGIDNPSVGGITTEDTGLLEFVLVFAEG